MSTLRSVLVFSLASLFLCGIPAAQRTKLSMLLPSGDLVRFVVSPDGSRAVYSARLDLGLYSVEVRDAATKLLDPGPCRGVFEIGAAGRVVYVRGQQSNQELCSVPIDGSAAPIVLAEVRAAVFRLGSGGQGVVFLDFDTGLWVVPTDGSAAPALLEAQPIPYHFRTPEVTPDGTRALYVHEDGGESGQGPLHAARLDRSTPPLVLNTATSECSLGSSFIGSPDGKWVVFRSGGLLFVNRRLFIVPIDGSASPALLHTPFPAGSFEAFDFGGPLFTPDATRVVYQIDHDVLGEDQLFSAPVDRSAPPIELSAPLPPGGQVVNHRVSLDGEQVVYAAYQDDAQVLELYVVPILGGTPRKLNSQGQLVQSFELSPDGRHVAYLADPDGPAPSQLFLASLVPGTDVIPLSDPASPARFPIVFDSGGGQIAYLSLLDGTHPCRVKTTGVPRPERLDAPSIPQSSVDGGLRFADGDSQLLFIADLERDEVFELWASPLVKRGDGRHRTWLGR